MADTNHYMAKLSIIRAIPDEKIIPATGIPVSIYIQEAENVCNWCQADREKLTANGLDWSLVDDLPARIDTLREAQSRWVTSDSTDIETEKQWDEKYPVARAFRTDLLRSLKFAFRKNHAALSKIKRFGDGASSAAMIQSLRDMAVFGADHIDELKKEMFDTSKLDRACTMSREMASLLGAVNSRRAYCSDSLKIRNQAYTYLKEALTEIKKHANFVLWRDSERLKGYTSDYNRKRSGRNSEVKETANARSVEE